MAFDDSWNCFCVFLTQERQPCFPSEGGGSLSSSSRCPPREVELPSCCHGAGGEDGEGVRPGGVLWGCV